MKPLHTIDNKQLIKFHPDEANIINKMVGQEITAIKTYNDLIESSDSRHEQTKFESLLKNHMLAKDFWKKEIISKRLKTRDLRSFKASAYRLLANLVSKFSHQMTMHVLKRFELMNLKRYKEIITNKSIDYNLKKRINKLFLYNQKRTVHRVNVFIAA